MTDMQVVADKVMCGARRAEALLKRARNIVREYELVGVPQDRFLLRIPATWQGIQAAKQLEADGIATHLVLVYRCACASPSRLPSSGLLLCLI